MSFRTFQRFSALLLLPICIGCAAGGPIIRSQSPNGELQYSHMTSTGHQVKQTRPVSHTTEYYESCPPEECPEERIWPHQYILGHFLAHHGRDHRGREVHHRQIGTHMLHRNHPPVGDWYPTHYHTYSYEQPRNLQYPSNNVPAGVIQYPYYTVKGPSDFFMK